MAIKGKGKSRSGRRVVAPPPRPQLVQRKPPIARRPVTWVVAGVVVVVLAGLLVRKGMIDHSTSVRAAEARALRTKEASGVLTVVQQVATALPPGTTAPSGGIPQIFTNVPTQLADIAAGKGGTPLQVAAEAKALSTAAGTAATAIGKVNVQQLIPASFTLGQTASMHTPGLTQLTLQTALGQMAQALQTYQAVGGLMAVAAELPAAQRAPIIKEATALVTTATSAWDAGYTPLLNMEFLLKLTSAVPTPAPTQVPSATATVSPKASPSAPASPSPKATSSP